MIVTQSHFINRKECDRKQFQLKSVVYNHLYAHNLYTHKRKITIYGNFEVLHYKNITYHIKRYVY